MEIGKRVNSQRRKLREAFERAEDANEMRFSVEINKHIFFGLVMR